MLELLVACRSPIDCASSEVWGACGTPSVSLPTGPDRRAVGHAHLLLLTPCLPVSARRGSVGRCGVRARAQLTSHLVSHLPPRAAREAGLQGGWGGGTHVALVSSLSRRASLGFERGGYARTVRVGAVSVLVSVRLLDVEDEACRRRRRREALERLHLRRRRRRLRHVRGERRVGRLGSG